MRIQWNSKKFNFSKNSFVFSAWILLPFSTSFTNVPYSKVQRCEEFILLFWMLPFPHIPIILFFPHQLKPQQLTKALLMQQILNNKMQTSDVMLMSFTIWTFLFHKLWNEWQSDRDEWRNNVRNSFSALQHFTSKCSDVMSLLS